MIWWKILFSRRRRGDGGADSAPELLPRQIEHQSWPPEPGGGVTPSG